MASAEKRTYYLSAITRSEGTRQHISELFNFEQDDMGEPEKEDFIDEALQIKSPNETIPEPIVGGPRSFRRKCAKCWRNI